MDDATADEKRIRRHFNGQSTDWAYREPLDATIDSEETMRDIMITASGSGEAGWLFYEESYGWQPIDGPFAPLRWHPADTAKLDGDEVTEILMTLGYDNVDVVTTY